MIFISLSAIESATLEKLSVNFFYIKKIKKNLKIIQHKLCKCM